MANWAQKYSYYVKSIFELLSGFEDPWWMVKLFLKLAPPGIKDVRLREAGLSFRVRSAMDVWSLKETFLDRFYERFGTPLQDGWTIVDIGGGIGEFTIFAAHNRPATTLLAFEPYPESFDLLKANLELNGIHNVKAFGEAVWSENGYLQLDSTAAEPSQFISRAAEASSAGSEQTLVPAITLTDVFTQNTLEACDLLKLDCEGAEFPILFSASGELLGKIERILLEYHDNAGNYSHQDLARYLSERGYQIKTTPNFVHSYLGYIFAWRLPEA
jgi:FkbM family methyltransferase